MALSRAFWQPGYQAFLDAATFLKHLVEISGRYDYQRRVEYVCLTNPQRDLQPVAPFMETSGDVLFPPTLRGDPTGGKFIGEWVDSVKNNVSVDTLEHLRVEAQRLKQESPYLKRISSAVVRLFCYHAVDRDSLITESSKFIVTSSTAFFISPKHLLTARTAKYDRWKDSYAHRFAFTTNVRALHGMLVGGVDLFDCFEVQGQVNFLADSIREIGVLLEETKMPCGSQSAPWCDPMLLEISDPRCYRDDTQYLLPEIAAVPSASREVAATPNNSNVLIPTAPIAKGEHVIAISYADRPHQQYLNDMFGDKGHNQPCDEEMLRGQFWLYHLKVASMGSFLDDVDARRVVKHNCSLLEGSRGCPLVHHTHVDFDNDAAKRKRIGEDSHGLEYAGTYCAVSVGRSVELVEMERENIISMSTSELARIDSLEVNMFNEALTVDHTSLVLLYLKFILSVVTNDDHRMYLAKYVHPFQVLVSKAMLSQCHRRMLKDADDYNEYGMDFYDHQDLESALACFREGAKMFSTASIPNLSQYEYELRAALQTNVSAVVVARQGKDQPKER
jgi:hypothetical protein